MAGAQQFEVFVSNIHAIAGKGAPSDPKLAVALYDHIHSNWDQLTRNSQHLDNVLESLDPETHSLAVLAIIIAKQSGQNTDQEQLFQYTSEFVNTANPTHFRAAPDLVYDMCHNLTEYLMTRNEAIRGIDTLSRCIQKTQENENQLLSIHADLLKLCLTSQCMKPALRFLAADILSISRENNSYDVKNFLLYYYYGGMVYSATKDHTRAHFFFEQAITCPSVAVSQIVVDAYKKWVLVSLIVTGKLTALPKYASLTLNRLIKPLVAQYNLLAQVYMKNDLAELHSTINAHRTRFVQDNNIGLVKQVASSLLKRNIQQLTKTFMTLSLTDMAIRVGLPSAAVAERQVLHMIEDGEIFAEINEKDGMVRFLDDPEKFNNPLVLRKIEDEMKLIIQLEGKVRLVNREMATDPKYIQKTREID